MPEASFIPKRNKSASPLGFDSLRSDAIKQIQQFSGEVWTDYNLHDPGITILEQLIYAITDLTYRTDFDIEDFLAGEDGNIDPEAQHLHAPAAIFPCRATTPLDYRKLILDAVPVADNVWLAEQDEQGQCRGLYRLAVKLSQRLDEHERMAAIDQIRAAYLASRNLCEDLGEIVVVDTLEYELCADIEVSSARHPAAILAEIYFECARRIASSVSITSYDQLVDRDEPLDQLFDGPFTRHGFFLDEDLREHQSEYLVSTLISAVNSIEGVDHIRQLHLARNGKSYYDMIGPIGSDQAFDLLIPGNAREIRVTLTTNGRVLSIALDELAARYHEVNFKYHISRSTPQDLSLLYKPIKGISRPLSQYFSIQNHFPVNYGINQRGVPDSASTAVKARARQLKGYLLIFEQLLANFLSNLDSVKTLFSARAELHETYAVQPLSSQQVQDLTALYPQDPGVFLRQVVAGFDNSSERRSRLLDYLLALYGERFNQNSLRYFNFYNGVAEVEDVIVANKIAYLESIIELGRDRVAAPDYSAPPTGRRVGGIALRIALLLGFEQRTSLPLTAAIREQGIKLAAHHEYQLLKADSDELQIINLDEMTESDRDSFEQPPLTALDSNNSLQTVRDRITDIPGLKSGLLSDLLLREGIYIDRYRIGRVNSSQEYKLLFEIEPDRQWHLGNYPDKSTAMRVANDLRQYLILLNKHCEGLHIVEHILLRPQREAADTVPGIARDEDFFSFRVSVIFPRWTARCHDRQFRLLAEETSLLNLPAHVYPEFYWLDLAQMSEFETLYEDWLDLKSNPTSTAMNLEHGAQQLMSFLLRMREAQRTGS